ncbi:hypothetical protein HELRODRAFT_177106 [Helobdella robusta]|uniref:Uncharacterized protein n=1 Tax=Helobdella robusta TaxID=6412 RepID=T1FB83_HELRO|nr:hypothetical protein HELRODRAFT_177106 [Helobdella robusta]ESN98227.1 hypothetical protein HELRODRAFT_177106 [Helobdella robusta]
MHVQVVVERVAAVLELVLLKKEVSVVEYQHKDDEDEEDEDDDDDKDDDEDGGEDDDKDDDKDEVNGEDEDMDEDDEAENEAKVDELISARIIKVADKLYKRPIKSHVIVRESIQQISDNHGPSYGVK